VGADAGVAEECKGVDEVNVARIRLVST